MNNISELDGSSISKVVQRSAGYPGYNLQDSLQFATELSNHFPAGQIINRHDVAALLGKSHGYVIRLVAAAVHFGFLIREDDGYKLSPEVKILKNSITDNEKQRTLLDAFSKPKLFQELIDKYDGHAIPADLKPHLIRFHKIVEKAAPEVEQIFLESASFCNAISANRLLNVGTQLRNLNEGNVPYIELATEQKPDVQHFLASITADKTVTRKSLGYDEDENPKEDFIELKILLTRKRIAYLKYPVDLVTKDVSIILKQVEVLKELTDE